MLDQKTVFDKRDIGPKRIALCLYGRFNNRLDPFAGLGGFEYIRDAVLDKYQVDVFIFSTDTENEEVVNKLYGKWAKASIFETELNFQDLVSDFGIDTSSLIPPQPFRTLENTLAFLYSRTRSIQLMSDYSKANRLSYDSVIVARFDLGQLDKVNGQRSHKVSEIGFSPEFDMSSIYSAAWEQHNEGVADQWFFSNQKNIETLGAMYKSTLRYFSPGSDYLKFISNGILDSNPKNKASNEILQPQNVKSATKLKMPINRAINNHLLHKYFFIDSGLYSKQAFTSDFHSAANVLYTHTDYKDIWPVFFGQQAKFLGQISNSYIFVNRITDAVPSHYKQIIYDDQLNYTDRLRSCLSQIPEKIILFQHEDMFLYKTAKAAYIANAINAMAVHNPKFDLVKLVRGGLNWSYPSTLQGFSKILQLSPWIISIQPSIWRTKSFIDLLSHCGSLNIWEFETKSQGIAKNLGIRVLHPSKRGRKRGLHHWESEIYPYIATAITKGKWNLSEYREELKNILGAYEVDESIRGAV